MTAIDHLPQLDSVAEVADFVGECDVPVYVRFSEDPACDVHEPSTDRASGLTLPGLAVNAMDPPRWWRDHPVEEWVVRQICTYVHLQDHDDRRICWLMTGTVVDRGPDNEPLLQDVRPLAVVTETAVREAKTRREPAERPEDEPEADGAAPWQS
jgi:hypothetical protein